MSVKPETNIINTYVGMRGGGSPPAGWVPGRAGILGADLLGGPGAGLLGSPGACLLDEAGRGEVDLL